ncbi:alpha/beta hydrolase [Variovorax sp. J22R133]|uniref:alpha/beta fold hydrolase n=1 Tax=Variovorax brevis TaxID=3053503 RepID=UPI002575CA7B|nr:alpha/beta hydrolase [Variovorax sp. J22R133]MDM0112317.1 alpha/beta hydrolase [Variovorax sp. J22R133]
MKPVTTSSSAVSAPNQFVEVGGRKLAWRSIGSGYPIVLCQRFRGNMDSWDPAFLDGLASHGFQVIIFDYSGIGLSTGERTYSPPSLAKDAIELIGALGLQKVVIGGWSVGGIAAQIVLAMAGPKVSHVVLLATTPPGDLAKLGEQLFFDLAAKPKNDLGDTTALFFEPASESSREAARRAAARLEERKHDLSVEVPADWAISAIAAGPRSPVFPAPAVLEAMKKTKTPILHIGGDHDIVFPVENWYALNRQLPTLQLLTFPHTGHGPQLQYVQESVDCIASFIKASSARA